MVLFERWAEAEAAQEAHNGRTRLNGSRPLVVSFANPKRIRPGEPPEPAIAPRKLFVGQVPKDATERDLRPLFEPFGEIVSLNVLRTQRGQGPSAGCAFVEFRKWAQAERAMEAHNGVTRLPGSEMPLVVKFADAKRPESGYPSPQGGHMGPRHGSWGALHHGMHPGAFHGMPPQGYMHGGLDPALAAQYGGLPYSLQNGGGAGGDGGALNPLGLPRLGASNPLLAAAAAAAGGQLSEATAGPALTGALPAAPLPLGASAADAAAAAVAAAAQVNVSDAAAAAGAAQLLGSLNNLSLSDQASIANAAGAAGALQAAGNLAGGSEADAQAQAQLVAINAGAASALEAALAGRPPPLGSDSNAGLLAAQQVLQQQQQQDQHNQQAVQQGSASNLLGGASSSLGGSGDLPAASSPSAAGAAAMAAGFTGDMANALAATSSAGSLSGGATASSAAAVQAAANVAAANAAAAGAAAPGGGPSIANGLGSGVTGLAYLGGLAPLGGAGGRLGEMAGGPPGAAPLPGAPAGGPGSRGLDQAASQWKLFIGQVPMEATEQDLWALFAPLGDILELYVLRNNQTGRSRGCAFVTYASRDLAQQAITALNGRQVGGGKTLVVKYADRVPI